MNKNILLPICLILISMVGIGCVSASDTNSTGMNDVTSQMTSNQSTPNQENATTENNSNIPKLNITGPKINNTNLNIKGPKITGKTPKITLSQMDKDIYHFAKVFINNPHWDLYDCIDYVRFHSSYKWREISIIVAKAHNIALHNYHGEKIMVLGWVVTPESVNYRSQNFYGWK